MTVSPTTLMLFTPRGWGDGCGPFLNTNPVPFWLIFFQPVFNSVFVYEGVVISELLSLFLVKQIT